MKTERDKLSIELFEAIENLRQAEQNFEYAESGYVDIALMELEAAKQRVAKIVQRGKALPAQANLC